jgi:hypothetical protein
MAQRGTVRPDNVKTLSQWAKQWGTKTNLGFEPTTREAVVYSEDGKRTVVKKFDWRREGDVLTILSNPTRFSAPAREAAQRRFGSFQEAQAQIRQQGELEIRQQETALLLAWQKYRAAPPETQAIIKREIMTAERTLRTTEEALARALLPERVGRNLEDYAAVYNPPMPMGQRGLPLAAASGAGAGVLDRLASALGGGGGSSAGADVGRPALGGAESSSEEAPAAAAAATAEDSS